MEWLGCAKRVATVTGTNNLHIWHEMIDGSCYAGDATLSNNTEQGSTRHKLPRPEPEQKAN
eukprot:1161114-Pelagomonas_calceolata.AAC.3